MYNKTTWMNVTKRYIIHQLHNYRPIVFFHYPALLHFVLYLQQNHLKET